MKKNLLLFLMLFALCLAGCSTWMDGEYHSVTPHTNQGFREETEIISVSNYIDIRNALEDMVRNAAETGTLSVVEYPDQLLETNLGQAIRYICNMFPLGAYAVEEITYEVGISRGVPAVAVTIQYNYNRSTIQRIRYASNNDEIRSLLTTALNTCAPSLVMYVGDYAGIDYLQFIRDYAMGHPSQVMELPQLTVNQYPESGSDQVVELQFAYQNSRDSLVIMQNYVQPVFSAATLYVSGESDETAKFDLLYTFLMERKEYTFETSITPTYSLLRHGVGDSKAFAAVYAAMCSRAGLECQVISGTKDGEPWFWNIIQENDIFYHVDLLYSYGSGACQKRFDDQMDGYVWDYSTYPPCPSVENTEDIPEA